MQKGDWVWIGPVSRSEYNPRNIENYQNRFGRVYQVMIENVGVYVTPGLIITFPKHQLRKVD